METYDVIVIGAGPVGENAADRAARTGLSVAVVEAELVGGECSYWACIPSKSLLRPGAARAAARQVPGLADPGAPDPAQVLAWRDEMTSDFDDDGQVSWLESAGLTLVRGHGRLVGERSVEVTQAQGVDDDADGAILAMEARYAVVVATGSAPVVPGVPGLAEANPWTSREATSAESVPESLVIVGGGVVGCEMATAYADLGARVTLVARGGLLTGAEPFAGQAVVASLREAGVDVRLGAELQGVERPEPGGPVTVTVSDADGGAPTQVTAAELLVATGRRTGDVGLDTLGLDPAVPLEIDDTTAVVGAAHDAAGRPWLYACGDVTGRVATTHQGKYQARVSGDVVAARFGGDGARAAQVPTSGTGTWSRYEAQADHGAQPQVVFTRPQVAWVGPTEAQAHAAGLPVRAVSYDLSAVSGASLLSPDYSGRAQILVDTAREVIVGATFVGPEAGEMLHAATIAVVGEVPLDRLWHAVPAFPTVSEVWLRFAEEYGL